MAVDITIAGKPYWNASDYSVAEDSTPVDPSDTSGGVGQISVTLPDTSGSKLLRNKTLVLSDGTQGTTTGSVRNLSGDGETVSLTADSRLSALNVVRTAQPFTGTLEAAFRYYLGLCGVRDGIVVDPGVAARQISFPGWQANVWDKIKQLVSAQRAEVSLVSNNIVLRPLRGRVAQTHRIASESWGHDTSSMAQSVEVYYYQTAQKTSLAYPLGGWNSDVQAYQVDAGAVVEFDISLAPTDDSPLGVSLESIVQPVCVATVAPSYSSGSVYTVAGNDGLPIPPSQWTAGGGKVAVKINEDTQSITVTITGMRTPQYAPYTIGMSSGDNTYYSSLRLLGSGVFFDREKIILPTGNTADVAPTEVGVTVDSHFISSLDDAYRAGIWTLAAYTSARKSLQVTSTGINREGDTGDRSLMTARQFNTDPDFAGKTASAFNTKFAGLDAKAFSDLQFAKVRDRFENQAFGNVGGARIFSDGSWYRIRSVSSITPDLISFSADGDDTAGDFNTAYAGMSVKDFNSEHAKKTTADFGARPFITRTADAIYIPVPNPDAIFPSLTLFPSDSLQPSG